MHTDDCIGTHVGLTELAFDECEIECSFGLKIPGTIKSKDGASDLLKPREHRTLMISFPIVISCRNESLEPFVL